MLYVVVVIALASLVAIHELVVRSAVRTIRRPWAVLLGPVVGYLLLAGCAFALYSTYGIAGEDEIAESDTGAAATAAIAFPVRATRDLVGQIRSMVASESADLGGPGRILGELADADRPAGQRVLAVVLLLGFYLWIALFLFDLFRIVRLSRAPDARSNVR